MNWAERWHSTKHQFMNERGLFANNWKNHESLHSPDWWDNLSHINKSNTLRWHLEITAEGSSINSTFFTIHSFISNQMTINNMNFKRILMAKKLKTFFVYQIFYCILFLFSSNYVYLYLSDLFSEYKDIQGK